MKPAIFQEGSVTVGETLLTQMHGYGGWQTIEDASAPNTVVSMTPKFLDVQDKNGIVTRISKQFGTAYRRSSYRNIPQKAR